MLDQVFNWVVAIAQNLMASFFAVVFGIAFTFLVRHFWDENKYGRWRVVIIKQGKQRVNRAISVEKTKEILREPAELSVFLKGVASPYGWINCDIIEKGETLGLLTRDTIGRCFIVDLDKNPPPEKTGPSNVDLLAEIKQLSQKLEERLSRDGIEHGMIGGSLFQETDMGLDVVA